MASLFMRSKLFVPGSRPEWFANALASAADAISIDLEDAVPETQKAQAREQVAAFLQSRPVFETAKLIVVRVNPIGSPHFERDLQAVARRGVGLVNLPKAESNADVRRAVAELALAAAANRAPDAIDLLVNIETPMALRRAAEIASAHVRVAGLQLGLGDLFEPAGIARRDPANVHAAMFALRLAAAEAGVAACDGAFADIEDPAGFRAEAQMAQRLGFVGKSCIHPSQIALANEVFRASDVDLAAAQRVVDAARAAAAEGRAAFVVDGRMIDPPFLARARALLASVAAADASRAPNR